MIAFVLYSTVIFSLISLLSFVLSQYDFHVKVVLFLSSVVSMFSIVLLLNYLGVFPKSSFRKLRSNGRYLLFFSLPSSATLLSSFVSKNSSTTTEVIAIFSSLVILSTNFLIFLFLISKQYRTKLKLLIYIPISILVSLLLLVFLGKNLVFLYSVLCLFLMVIFWVSRFLNVEPSDFKVLSLMSLIFLVLLGMLFLYLLPDKSLPMVFTLVSVNILILVVIGFALNNLRIVMVVSFIWVLTILFSVFSYLDVMPKEIIKSNLILIFGIPIISFLMWYFRRRFISYEDLLRDIDSFVKNFKVIQPREFESPKDFVVRVFNSSSSYLKISIMPQNMIPTYILNKMLDRRRLSLFDVLNSDRKTIDFFISNNIILVSRISNEVSETDYIVVKFLNFVHDLSSTNVSIIRSYTDIFLELERTVSNFIVIPVKSEIDRMRELHVKEVEEFERVKYLLIKNSDYYIYFDKIVGYRYNEGFEGIRGYYFDVIFSTDKLIGFLFYVPDMLMLSNFALLAIKGIIKSYSYDSISYITLHDLVTNFIKERDLPLKISLTYFEIDNQKMRVFPSDITNTYYVENGIISRIVKPIEVSKDAILIISTKEVEKLYISDNMVNKKAVIDGILSNFKDFDSFMAVCV
ncbi:MAG: hypothetical protein N2712_02950 [Brevinematales bacterium]|nr:hypothetical protein [Brevinematales bacterium]